MFHLQHPLPHIINTQHSTPITPSPTYHNHPTLNTHHPTFNIQHSIPTNHQHPTFTTHHPTLNTHHPIPTNHQHPTFTTHHPTFTTQHPTLNTHHPIPTNHQHPTFTTHHPTFTTHHPIPSMRAIILGATGAIGKDLVQELINDDTIEQIAIFVRRDPGINNEKVTTHIVDFDQSDKWRLSVQGDVVFSCMGTTRKAAGSKENQYKIDYTYQYNFAKIAAEQGVPSFVLVSTAMANANSHFFYTRIKGELEEAIKQLPFQHISILRPPALIRKNTTRSAEKLSVSILQFFNKIGLLQSQRPMKTEVVAHCMVELAKTEKSGVFEPKDIFKIGER